MKPTITVETLVNVDIEKVWKYWTEPEHITQWCQASDDWHAPHAENDVRVGGKFTTTMAAKDGSVQFDFAGVYSVVKPLEALEYDMADGRHVSIRFIPQDGGVKVIETFDPETVNSHELQKNGWQAILENFKKHVEAN